MLRECDIKQGIGEGGKVLRIWFDATKEKALRDALAAGPVVLGHANLSDRRRLMVSVDSSDLNDMQRAVRDAVRLHWRLFLVQGVILIILGILAVCAPVVSTIVIDIYVGCLFLIGGIIGLVAVFSFRDMPAFAWSLITAALSVVIGVLLIWKPATGAASLTVVLTAFFIAEGLFQTAASIAYRDVLPGAWGWMLLSGLADLVLAAVIIIGWPVTAAWTLGIIVGINLITSGFAIVMVAMAGRDFVKTLTDDFRGMAAG